MKFTERVHFDIDPMDVVLQANEIELQDLVSQALAKILDEGVEIGQPLQDMLRCVCKSEQCWSVMGAPLNGDEQ